ncbi:MAG: UDP-3-O-acyl-N-acetylglucosamine deacetylase [Fidelibacterota bacterium]
MNIKQQTIASSISCSGVGLHTGLKCKLTFRPALENSGVNFVRTDLKNESAIPADVAHVVDTARGTTLSRKGVIVRTIEHVLAALAGLQIDNVTIELTAEEPPIMDGSALPFVKLILEAGVTVQAADRELLEVDRQVVVEDTDHGNRIEIKPYREFRINGSLEYNEGILAPQTVLLERIEDFSEEIAPARTFGFLSELKELRRAGLAQGGSLENAVIFVDRSINDQQRNELAEMFGEDEENLIGSNGILNLGGLRFPDEPVRHKVLDLVGDLMLLGSPIRGEITAQKMSHALNVEFVKKLRQEYPQKKEAIA